MSDRKDMEMVEEIEGAIRRPRQYWFDDGLTEIIAGVILAAVGLFFAIEAGAGPSSPLARLSAPGLPILVLLAYFAGGRALRWLKERVTYPRSGFVAYRRQPRHRPWLAAVAGAAIAAAIVMAFRGAPSSLRWIPFMDGLAVAVFLAFMAYQATVRRFYGLALVSVGLGLLASGLFADETAGTAVYFGMMGLALGISGALGLRRYLAVTSLPTTNAEEPTA